ncbi:baseplate J/gp47 family protein [Bombella intestini]|uniref:baseplate J/gp47 family protein n=1 Tax=Bombella intestini TaxID=1539051 RepID=UPI00098600B9|nr:baseplate J/gp47 family protein [Bombella intestini]
MATIDISTAQIALLEDQYPGLLTTLQNSGVQPTAPQTLQDQLVQLATQLSPGVTTNLPGSLVEDMASTAIGALAQIDQAKVDTINSVSPLNATPSLLDEFGEVYGVQRGAGANPSAYVTFTGPPGLYLASGFQVSDGIYTYETQEGATIPSGGVLVNSYVLSTTPGTTIIPENSITTVVTGTKEGTHLAVTNPQKGTPGTGAETDSAYRARILQTGMRTVQGTPGFIRSRLLNVPNVIPRSIGVSLTSGAGYSVMVDGGDPAQIAGAIYESCFDLVNLQGSTNTIASITSSNPCIVTTTLTHGLKDGQQVTISGETGAIAINGTFTATVLDASRFSIPVDTTTASQHSGDGIVGTNPRNMVAVAIDGVDSYPIRFIRPLQQQVRLVAHWSITSGNVVDDATATQICGPPLSNYINGLTMGAPLSTLQLGTIVEATLLQIMPGAIISSLRFDVFLDDVLASPAADSVIIACDPQSYLVTSPDQISLVRE